MKVLTPTTAINPDRNLVVLSHEKLFLPKNHFLLQIHERANRAKRPTHTPLIKCHDHKINKEQVESCRD